MKTDNPIIIENIENLCLQIKLHHKSCKESITQLIPFLNNHDKFCAIILKAYKQQLEEELSNIKRLVNQSVNNLTERRLLIEQYKLNDQLKFNFFTSISDSYYIENFHSNILKLILDPSTPTLGNRDYLKLFIHFLSCIRPELELMAIQMEKHVSIERERCRIDILIIIGDNAIIIENKINYAVDQKNQLHRYYEYVIEKQYKLKAIVYLTPNIEKYPSLSHCDPRFESYIDRIKEKLIIFPVISRNGNYDLLSLIKEFKKLSTNITSKIYLEQYCQLLAHLGGDEMVKELSKKILIQIHKDRNMLSAVKDVVEIWQNRSSLLGEMLEDYILSNSTDFIRDRDIIMKRINSNLAVAIDKKLCFGFYKTNGEDFTDEEKVKFVTMLEKISFRRYAATNGIITKYGLWVYFDIDFDLINFPFNIFFENVIEAVNELCTLCEKEV